MDSSTKQYSSGLQTNMTKKLNKYFQITQTQNCRIFSLDDVSKTKFLLPLPSQMLRCAWNKVLDTCVYISKVPKYAAFIFSEMRLLLYLKMLLEVRTLSRSRYRILSTTKTVLSVTNVNRRKPLDILTNISTSNVAEDLNPPLTEAFTIAMFIVLD